MPRAVLAVVASILLAGCTAGAPAPPETDDPEPAAPSSPPAPPRTARSSASAPDPAASSTTTSPAPSPSPSPSPPPSPSPSPSPSPAPAPSRPTPASPPEATAYYGVPGPADPLRVLPGADASSSFASVRIREDGRSFDAYLRAVSGATLRADALVTFENAVDAPIRVTLRPAAWSDARVPVARLLVGEDALDLSSSAPLEIELAPRASRDVGIELRIDDAAPGETIAWPGVAIDVRSP